MRVKAGLYRRLLRVVVIATAAALAIGSGPALAATSDLDSGRFLLLDESVDILPAAFTPSALLAPTSPVEPGYQGQGIALASLGGSDIPDTIAIWRQAFAQAPSGYGVLRSVAIRVGHLPAMRNWEHATDRDYSWLYAGTCPSDEEACRTPFAGKMHALVAAAQQEEPVAALEMINRGVNHAIAYRPDIDLWHVADYWENPREIAEKGAGDCEDYAIAKFWLLRSMGVAASDLQLIVLTDQRNGAYHAVLGVHLAGATYILDSLTDHVAKDDLFIRYTPIMSFVGDTGYIHGFRTGDTRTVASANVGFGMVAPGEPAGW